jgi:MFS family permease
MFIWIHNVAMLFAARFITGVAAALSAGAAVAWLREHNPGADAQRAGVLIVAMNVLGLGVGPLLTGLMAPADTQPLVLPYVAFIAIAVPLAVVIAFTRETVEDRSSILEAELIHPIGVPRDLRVAFLAPGVTTFVIYSMVGFYSAIAPGLIVRVLHISGYAPTGTIVFELFATATLTVFLGQKLSDRTAMIGGAAFMLPALACLVLAEITASLPALLAGTALGGIALGFGWRGALHLTAEIAPEHQRSEMVSALFVCGNFGMTLPVIGIGVMETLTYPQLSILVFSGVIAVISSAGVVFGVMNHAE